MILRVLSIKFGHYLRAFSVGKIELTPGISYQKLDVIPLTPLFCGD
jgi:hypothetical protein